MLRAEELHAGYGSHRVLGGISLTVAPGELVVLAGPNGAGKSTLVRCLLGLLAPTAGRVTIDGADLAAIPARERARHLAYVPQALPERFPLTVFDSVLLGRRPYLGWCPAPRDLEIAGGWLQRLGLADLALREADRLSGGQQQRMLLARALAQEARYLLLDEPTSNLDLRYQLEGMELLQQAARDAGCGVLAALHDLNLAARYADRLLLLHDGRLLADGPPEEVLQASLIREAYGVEAVVSDGGGYRHVVALRPAT